LRQFVVFAPFGVAFAEVAAAAEGREEAVADAFAAGFGAGMLGALVSGRCGMDSWGGREGGTPSL